ncbi:spermidine synthase [Candidatus Falkowbacteria bacterium CG10_big_fil_rev_8_21_14_0_10_43_10]|uniref:Spermidine synthase n=1 Tax=Candidatus Falkowbacteria bacterium CG10_big_fil_rev_8_21_14_0_10_43_10 TaxID=1974567 RepID=A0A2H0V430_9BACT|nr:MAG: spermidine synthase [Candidatus Falkowbacteria bacterium CG10_big_fil_rev_8_21_14_0_10_43_10]
MKKYVLELIVFICGAAVMVLELIGSRVLAPYLGTSIFVWTSLIGIILGSLSLGYYYGGRISDKYPDYKIFSLIIFLSAVCVTFIALLKFLFLTFLMGQVEDIKAGSVIAATVLFAPPSILLGMVSPYAVKLKIKDLAGSGSTVGNLYAISTVGSIAGTFLAGFWLIPQFGNTAILYGIAVVLLGTSILVYARGPLLIKAAILILIMGGMAGHLELKKALADNGVLDIDTQYSRVLIFNGSDYKTNRPVKYMQCDTNSNSAMFLDSGELVFEYTKYYDLAAHFKPDFKKSLMIGGAAYSYPKYYLKKYPNAEIDVVEIDPKLTELAKQYFDLRDNPRLRVYHQDGRIFLNKTENKYDIIFGDAFRSSHSIPYQLTTKESAQAMYGILNDGGAVLINIISAIEGDKGKFLRAEYKTFKSVFPQVYLFYVQTGEALKSQNLMLAALKSEEKPQFANDDKQLNLFLHNLWTAEITDDLPILTDEYAPVDNYIMELL